MVNGTHTISDLPVGDYLITHIQRDEIGRVSDDKRRNALFSAFEFCGVEQVPSGVFVLGVSKIGLAAIGGEEVYGRIYNDLTGLDCNKRKQQSHMADATIGATAYVMGLGLVTADACLSQVMKEILPEHHLVVWRNG